MKRGRAIDDIMFGISKDLEIQRALINELRKVRYGMHRNSEEKERLLNALIHKTEINLKLLKIV